MEAENNKPIKKIKNIFYEFLYYRTDIFSTQLELRCTKRKTIFRNGNILSESYSEVINEYGGEWYNDIKVKKKKTKY